MKVNILGTDYEISYITEEEMCEIMFGQDYAGSCCANQKKIWISKMNHCQDPKEVITEINKRSLRHEIIHAFLNESGLQDAGHNAEHWSHDEEIVDWFAIQAPKIFKAYQEAGAL